MLKIATIAARACRAVVAAVAVLSLAACAASPKSDTDAGDGASTVDWYERRLVLAERRDWQTNGRIAVQSDKDAWSGAIDWTQTSDEYRIEFFGPLGGRRMLLQGGPGRITLTDADGEQLTDTGAQRLIARHTGWNLPVGGLRYWALALPAPGRPARQLFGDNGHLSELKQDGWHIRYQEYQISDGVALPRLIRIMNEENIHLQVKLLLSGWRFAPQ